MGSVQAGEGESRSGGSGRRIDCSIREGFSKQSLSDLESDVVRQLLSAGGAPGRHTQGRWEDEAARYSDGAFMMHFLQSRLGMYGQIGFCRSCVPNLAVSAHRFRSE